MSAVGERNINGARYSYRSACRASGRIGHRGGTGRHPGDRLGLPIGGIVALLLLLMRLGLLNFGERSSATVQHWQPNTAVQGPQPVSPPSAAPPSQRLQELEALRTSGAISDTEYAERRAGIISGI